MSMAEIFDAKSKLNKNKEFDEKYKAQLRRDQYRNIDEIKKLVKNSPKFNKDLEVLKFLNSGACGIVYEGRIRQTPSKRVALKFIFSKKIGTDKEKKQSLIINKEINLQTKLKHKNITNLYGVYEICGDCICTIMELAKHGDLYHFHRDLIQKKCLSETLLAYFTKQILNGLNCCHQSKIIHMDIKHQNVLIDENLNIKLTDFSVSYSYANFPPKSAIELPVAGTSLFMSPEVLNKKKIFVEDCNKIDMFSLGTLLFNLATDQYPYDLEYKDKKDFPTIKKKIATNDLKLPKTKKHSPLFRNFISGLLHKDIKLRTSIQEAMKHPWMQAANLIFDEKEKIFDLEKFFVNMVTDGVKSFNEFLMNYT